MIKQFRSVASFMLLGVTALLWTGCHHNNNHKEHAHHPPKESSKSDHHHSNYHQGKGNSLRHHNDFDGCGVHTEINAAETATIGSEYPVSIDLKAHRPVSDVRVESSFDPAEASYVRSEPEGKLEGNTVVWEWDYLEKNEHDHVTYWLKPKMEGHVTTCTAVHAVPTGCVITHVGAPKISITKNGPEMATLGDKITYEIVVANDGTMDAHDVVITDMVPDGLTHSTGKNTVNYKVGTLKAGQSKKVPISFNAAKRGRYCNKATVNTSDAGSMNAEACTTIVEHAINIVKRGMDMQFVDKKADYQITVSNSGDTDLTGVTVVDNAPHHTRIDAAPGASVSGDRATWNVGTLKAGDKKSFTVTLIGQAAGRHCNKASVNTNEGVRGDAEYCTDWKGHPALLIEVVDIDDPLLVGGETTYRIRVTNQGTAQDSNIAILVRFPSGMSPVSASGDTEGTVTGQIVKFAPYGTLQAKEAIEFVVRAKATSVGDQRIKVELTSKLLRTPVVEEESTHVY